MGCPGDREIVDYLAGNLSEATRDGIRDHLDGCADCVDLIAQVAQRTSLGRSDQLTLGRTISSGGMGVVVEAHDRRLERRIALKLPRTNDPAVLRRFEREVKISARLQHPAIVPVYAAGTLDDGEPYYAMRLVEGESLDAAIGRAADRKARLALVRAVTVVADAIAYAHSQGILHRDIKPANVLVGRFGEVVVIDWGLAKSIGDGDEELAVGSPGPAADDRATHTADGAVLGTPAYMAPEQARGEPVDERADVYALGALLHHVLRGRPPGRDPQVELAAEPELPRDLIAIVAHAMAPDPADRYRTAADLAADLERFQTGRLVGAHVYSPRQLIRRWLRRNRVAVTVAALALLTLLAISAVSVARIVRAEHTADDERRRAVAHRIDAESLMDFMLVDLRDKLRPAGQLELLDVVAAKARAYYAHRPAEDAPGDRARRATALQNVGDVLLARGDAPGALATYREALAIQQVLAFLDPHDRALQRGLGISHERIGDVLARQGDAPGALASYRAGLAIGLALAAAAPASVDAQHDLSLSHKMIGGALLEQGDVAEALVELRAAMTIDASLAAADPANRDRRHSLSVSHARIGDALLRQGDDAAALVEYGAGLDLDASLAAADPTNVPWQRDLALSHLQVADVLQARGDLAGALGHFRAGLAIDARLVATDGSNTDWRRDLEVAHDRVGTVLMAQRDWAGAQAELDASLALAAQLAATDVTNLRWQRDLSASHDKVGQLRQARGDLDGALAAFGEGLVVATRLAAGDPTDATLQRDVAISHLSLGALRLETGDRPGALADDRRALAIVEALAAADPTPEARSDLAEVHANVAEVLVASGDRPGARVELEAALALAEQLVVEDPTSAPRQHNRDAVASQLDHLSVAPSRRPK